MKKKLKFICISIILCICLISLSGCGIEKDLKKIEEGIKNELEEKTKSETTEKSNEEEENNTKNQVNTTKNETNTTKNQTNTTKNDEITAKKAVDKTPVDIKANSSYYFVVNGKKYNVGDKISSLATSNLRLNNNGGEKELQKNGYLIGGGGVLDSKNNTVFNITPYNNGQSKVKASETVIGGFSLNQYGYKYLSGNIEICNGITIGTSLEDIKAVFGEPTSKTEATAYSGPTYTYDTKTRYMQFVFKFDKDEKVETISWQNFNLN